MKNIKNTVSAAGLMAVLVFGAMSANAGLIKGSETGNTAKVNCTVNSEGFLKSLKGIINGLTGIIIFDAKTPICTEPSLDRVRWS